VGLELIPSEVPAAPAVVAQVESDCLLSLPARWMSDYFQKL
jgi:hypothetical protein